MSTHDIKIIALDLDGTLLDSEKRLSPGNLKALTAASETGIEIVPATGRLYNGMPEAVRSLPFIRYAITVNGAQVLDVKSGETMYGSAISTEDALALCRYLDTLPVIYDCYSDGGAYMTQSMYDAAAEYIEDRHSLKMVKDLRRPVPELKAFIEGGGRSPQKMQLFTKDEALRSELLTSLPLRFPQFAITTSLPQNIEINNIETDKGKALLGLAARLGFAPEQTMAIGDGLNDMTMLKAAGTGVAMGNAHPDILKIADKITSDNDHDGVADAIYQVLNSR